MVSVHMLFVGSMFWKPLFNPVLSPDRLCCSVRFTGLKKCPPLSSDYEGILGSLAQIPTLLKRVKKSLIPNYYKSDRSSRNFLPSPLEAFLPFL